MSLKKVITIKVLLITILTNLIGQENNEWKHNFYGFIRADGFMDTRKSAEAVDGLFLLYPLNEITDSSGKDLNKVSQLTFTSISSRMGLTSGGKKLFNSSATIKAKLEADFTARSNTNSLRLRHAYIVVSWEKHQLLFGRTWHPMFTPQVFPYTSSINLGTPFNPFNRSPQLRYIYKPTSYLSVLSAVLYQNDYVNLGPDGTGQVGKRRDLMRNSKFPNLHLQPQIQTQNINAGIFVDYKKIQPRTSTQGLNGIFKTEQKIESLATGVFISIKTSKLKIKTKSFWGQNLSDHALTGGYAINTIDPLTGAETYTPSNHIFTWINLEYGKDIMGGIFLGYNKNMGFSQHPIKNQPIFARGANIDYIYRISPYIKWSKERFELWAGTELTTAAYGNIDYTNKGKITDPKEVTNIRLQISCVYLIL